MDAAAVPVSFKEPAPETDVEDMTGVDAEALEDSRGWDMQEYWLEETSTWACKGKTSCRGKNLKLSTKQQDSTYQPWILPLVQWEPSTVVLRFGRRNDEGIMRAYKPSAEPSAHGCNSGQCRSCQSSLCIVTAMTACNSSLSRTCP